MVEGRPGQAHRQSHVREDLIPKNIVGTGRAVPRPALFHQAVSAVRIRASPPPGLGSSGTADVCTGHAVPEYTPPSDAHPEITSFGCSWSRWPKMSSRMTFRGSGWAVKQDSLPCEAIVQGLMSRRPPNTRANVLGKG